MYGWRKKLAGGFRGVLRYWTASLDTAARDVGGSCKSFQA